MRCVNIESPYAGDISLNLRYLRACMQDCLLKGEAPFASHGLYTQPGVLRDEVPEERKLGMEAGFEINKLMEATVVYTDLGITSGMEAGIQRALDCNRVVEYRTLPNWQLDLDNWGYDSEK